MVDVLEPAVRPEGVVFDVVVRPPVVGPVPVLFPVALPVGLVPAVVAPPCVLVKELAVVPVGFVPVAGAGVPVAGTVLGAVCWGFVPGVVTGLVPVCSFTAGFTGWFAAGATVALLIGGSIGWLPSESTITGLPIGM